MYNVRGWVIYKVRTVVFMFQLCRLPLCLLPVLERRKLLWLPRSSHDRHVDGLELFATVRPAPTYIHAYMT